MVIGSVMLAGTASAQTQAGSYPDKPIKMVVAYPAGGGTDVMARLFGQELARLLKQSVAVDNRAGGGGIVGTQVVANSPPDGYTLLFTAIGELTIPDLLTTTVPYKRDDFAPIGRIAFSPFVLLANKEIPVTSVQELVALANNPRKPYSISAPANYSYLTSGLFKLEAGLDFEIVRYRGSAPAMTDLVAGNVQVGFDTIAVSLPHIRSGNVRPLAVAAEKRSMLRPEIPTMAESGFPMIIGGAWYGLAAPKGVPEPVIERLRWAIASALESKEFLQKLSEQGFEPFPNDTPAAFDKFLTEDSARWHSVAAKVGFK